MKTETSIIVKDIETAIKTFKNNFDEKEKDEFINGAIWGMTHTLEILKLIIAIREF